MGGAITQRNGVWVVDLRAFPSVRTALAGTELALPGEGPHGDGYQVLRTDHHGLLAAAGIRPGDVLIGVDALPLRTPDEALDAMARLRRANRATFVFRRGSETFRVPVEVQGRPPDLELVP
jgi:S1-C subfamily serine protease